MTNDQSNNAHLDRIHHTAIVVADMDEAISRWQALTGAELELRERVEHQRVEIAMLAVGDTRVELIRSTHSTSGVARFLEKRGETLHHLAFAVDDINASIRELERDGYEMIDHEPRPGADGMVAFLHPRATGGVLVELIETGERSAERK